MTAIAFYKTHYRHSLWNVRTLCGKPSKTNRVTDKREDVTCRTCVKLLEVKE